MTQQQLNVTEVQTTKTTTRPKKSPKTPKVKVSKDIAQQLEEKATPTKETPTQESLNIVTKETKENEMESVNMENVKEMMNVEEVEVNEEEGNEEVATTNKEVLESSQEESYEDLDENSILTRDELVKLTFAEQVKLMEFYRENFQVEQIKQKMGLSTSSYYHLMKRLGLHGKIARPLSQPRGTQKKQTQQKTTKEITFDFIGNGVRFEGDLNLEVLLEKLDGFIKFGGGNESDFEFKFELVRK